MNTWDRELGEELRSGDGKSEGLIAVADGEPAGGASQGGDGGGRGVASRGRGRCHPVQEKLPLPCPLVLCAGQFRRTKTIEYETKIMIKLKVNTFPLFQSL